MIRSRAIRRCLVAATLGASFCKLPLAWGENLRDVPLGGRTAAMGGAGVAAGADSATPFLNPAGVAGTPHDIISVSASVYSGLGAVVPLL